MKSAYDCLTRSKTVFLALFFTTALKLIYYFSRPLFESGPDANGYIPAAIALADRGITSTDIPGMPVYPSGYPLFLVLVQFIIADVIVYGDNRHRLIALPFMIPAIAYSSSYFWLRRKQIIRFGMKNE